MHVCPQVFTKFCSSSHFSVIDETFPVSVVANTQIVDDGNIVLVDLDADLREERQNGIWIDIVRILSL